MLDIRLHYTLSANGKCCDTEALFRGDDIGLFYLIGSRFTDISFGRIILYISTLLIFSGPVFAASFPSPSGSVNDFAGIIPKDTTDRIYRISCEVLKKTSVAIVVATLKDVGGNEVNKYATDLFNKWRIGKNGENKGVLILLAVKERRVVIRTGYGIEKVLSDKLCGKILDQDVIPYFREGAYGAGFMNAVVSISRIIAKDASVTLSEK